MRSAETTHDWMPTLAALFDAVTFRSRDDFDFAGQTVPPTEGATRHLEAMAGHEDSSLARLQLQIYHAAFAREFRGEPAAIPAESHRNDELVRRLTQANPGRSRWEQGWRITRIEDNGTAIAERAGMVHPFVAGQYVVEDGEHLPPRPRTSIRVFLPCESLTAQDGFYYVYGESTEPLDPDHNPLRFYFNTRAETVAEVMQHVAGVLNRYEVPFRLKCPTAIEQYPRLDSTVVYFHPRLLRIVSMALRGLEPRLRPLLDDPVPLFTRGVADGIAFAEDPGNGESFGLHRSRLIAEALLQCHDRGELSSDSCLKEFRSLLERQHISINAAYARARYLPQYDDGLMPWSDPIAGAVA